MRSIVVLSETTFTSTITHPLLPPTHTHRVEQEVSTQSKEGQQFLRSQQQQQQQQQPGSGAPAEEEGEGEWEGPPPPLG